jgi:single-strand DNA-binding protein
MNQLTIIGNLTADPVSRTTQAGKNVTTFTVAVNRRKTANAGQQEADYFRVSAWGELGNLCHKWLIKGKKVCVVGRVSVSTYTTQNGETRANMDVFADSVEFLSPANTVPGEKPVQQEAPKTNTQGGFVQVNDEPLPF